MLKYKSVNLYICITLCDGLQHNTENAQFYISLFHKQRGWRLGSLGGFWTPPLSQPGEGGPAPEVGYLAKINQPPPHFFKAKWLVQGGWVNWLTQPGGAGENHSRRVIFHSINIYFKSVLKKTQSNFDLDLDVPPALFDRNCGLTFVSQWGDFNFMSKKNVHHLIENTWSEKQPSNELALCSVPFCLKPLWVLMSHMSTIATATNLLHQEHLRIFLISRRSSNGLKSMQIWCI